MLAIKAGLTPKYIHNSTLCLRYEVGSNKNLSWKACRINIRNDPENPQYGGDPSGMAELHCISSDFPREKTFSY